MTSMKSKMLSRCGRGSVMGIFPRWIYFLDKKVAQMRAYKNMFLRISHKNVFRRISDPLGNENAWRTFCQWFSSWRFTIWRRGHYWFAEICEVRWWCVGPEIYFRVRTEIFRKVTLKHFSTKIPKLKSEHLKYQRLTLTQNSGDLKQISMEISIKFQFPVGNLRWNTSQVERWIPAV